MNKCCEKCITCKCFTREVDKLPSYCPTITNSELLKESRGEFKKQDVRKITQTISKMTKERYAEDPRWTRIEEIVRFCQIIGFKTVGLASCVAFHEDAKEIAKLIQLTRIDVHLVLCQVGALTEEDTGVWMPRISHGFVPSVCNPIMQAEVLNAKKTDLNITVGLCLGDDLLFQKYSKAPVTTLVVKDRATGNDTLAPIHAFHLRGFLENKLKEKHSVAEEEPA